MWKSILLFIKDEHMDIYMTGINYSNAELEYREMFSLTLEDQSKIAKN